MSKIRCRVCGSRSLRADRALAGRIICNNCGTPINSKGKYRQTRFHKNFHNIYPLFFALIILILVITLL